MSATLISSVPITPVSMNAYVPAPIAAFSPATSSSIALFGGERNRADGLDAVGREAVVEDAVEVVDRVARAERVRGRETSDRNARRIDVLLVVAVVEDERAPVVEVLLRDRRGPRRRDRGRRVEAAALGEADLAEACERERLGRGERL